MAFITTTVTEIHLQVEYVLSDYFKNYYQEENQPNGEKKNRKRPSPKFLFQRAFFSSIIDKHQNMHFFTFKTVLV